MPEIRRAGPDDYSRLVELTAREGWNYSTKDFADMARTGCTTTLVAVTEGEVNGMITLMDYGNLGWISNVLVDAAHRQRHLGAELVEGGVEEFRGKKTIALFAYEDAVQFYVKAGFRLEGIYSVVRYLGGQKGSGRVGDLGLDAIAGLDERAFSVRRRGLLGVLMEGGRVLVPEEGEGFALVRPDESEPIVGPVVCTDRSVGRDLMYAALNSLGPGAMAVMVGELAPGIEVVGRVSRLYLGEAPRTDSAMAVTFAGLEFG